MQEQLPIVPIYQNLLVEEIGIDRRIHTPILRTIAYSTNFSGPIDPGNRGAIGTDRQIRIPIEGVNKYRYAIPQPVDIPIGMVFNRLLSRVCYTCGRNTASIGYWQCTQYHRPQHVCTTCKILRVAEYKIVNSWFEFCKSIHLIRRSTKYAMRNVQ